MRRVLQLLDSCMWILGFISAVSRTSEAKIRKPGEEGHGVCERPRGMRGRDLRIQATSPQQLGCRVKPGTDAAIEDGDYDGLTLRRVSAARGSTPCD